jgi:hypothetical protein
MYYQESRIKDAIKRKDAGALEQAINGLSRYDRDYDEIKQIAEDCNVLERNGRITINPYDRTTEIWDRFGTAEVRHNEW